MQDYDFGVTLADIEVNDNYSPLPPGDYEVMATKLELKETKNGMGKYLQFEFVVSGNAYQNRKLFQNIIVEHSNEDAKRIGLQLLKSWILACNGTGQERLTLSLLYRFLNQPCTASIVIEEGNAGYADKNKITKFQKIQTAAASDMPF